MLCLPFVSLNITYRARNDCHLGIACHYTSLTSEKMKHSIQLPSTLLGLLLVALCPAHTTANPVQVQVVTVTAAPSIPSTVPQFTNTALFTSAILNSTNVYRKEHNATAVSWNHTLASYASSYLSAMGTQSPDSGSECDFAHSGGPYGENLAIGCNEVTGCVELWGDERDEYDFNDPGFSEKTGHFTQLVWKDTTTVGCGRRLCGTRAWYLVCEYWPRGNVIGEFSEEVDREVNSTTDGAPGNNGMWSWAPRVRPAEWPLYISVLAILAL